MSLLVPNPLKSIKLKTTSDSGISNSDNITNFKIPVFEIVVSDEASVGNKIHIYNIDKTIVHTYTIQASDLLSSGEEQTVFVSLSDPLSEGEHRFIATIENRVHRESAYTKEFILEIDSENFDEASLEVNSGSIINGSITNDLKPVISGTSDKDSTIVIKDQGVIIATIISDSLGNYSYTPLNNLSKG